ncbi:MAG: tetratricopeptide repeat protein [Solirubrobacterales bacterium]
MKIGDRKKAKELAAVKDEGRKLFVAQKERETLEFLEEAVRRFPEDPEIRLLYATSLLPFRPEGVAAEAAKAVELGPDDPKILVGAGHRLLFAGQIEAAQSCATRASELAPPDFPLMPSLVNLKGSLAALAGEDDLAEENLRSAVASEPDNEPWARRLAVFLAERGRLQEGAEVLDEALAHVEKKDEIERMRDRMAAEAEGS